MIGGKPTSGATYISWSGMRHRCRDERMQNFKYYGARGIRVCERWMTFANFLADMGERPSKAHSIDRIDVDGHYEPGNCRWALHSEQMKNQRPRTHCRNGHEYDGLRSNGKNRCRICLKAAWTKFNRKRGKNAPKRPR
jgi:hypothetical protein